MTSCVFTRKGTSDVCRALNQSRIMREAGRWRRWLRKLLEELGWHIIHFYTKLGVSTGLGTEGGGAQAIKTGASGWERGVKKTSGGSPGLGGKPRRQRWTREGEDGHAWMELDGLQG